MIACRLRPARPMRGCRWSARARRRVEPAVLCAADRPSLRAPARERARAQCERAERAAAGGERRAAGLVAVDDGDAARAGAHGAEGREPGPRGGLQQQLRLALRRLPEAGLGYYWV